jgi:hypothetical protein
LNVGASSGALSGNTYTLKLAITFQSGYAGAKNVYSDATSQAGLNSGWQTVGTWTVGASSQGPSNVSVTPSSGAGPNQTFSFTSSSPNGYGYISSMQMVLNYGIDGDTACYLQYNPASNLLYLWPDIGSSWGSSASVGVVGAATLSNTQCQVNVAGSSVSSSFDMLTLNLAITFQPSFLGPQNVYLSTNDNGGQYAYWQQVGTWTGYAAPYPTSSPTATVTPSSGTGVSQQFTYTVTDQNGYGYIPYFYVLFNTAISGPNACYLFYKQSDNIFGLYNDQTTGDSTANYGSPTILSNSQCSLNVLQSTVSESLNNLVVTFDVTFLNGFAGTKNNYIEAVDHAGQGAVWQTMGTWTVPAPVTTITTAPATGQALTVDGAACTSPCTFQWTPETSHTVVPNSPVAVATGTQYVFLDWSGGLVQSNTITAPSSATTYTANFSTQYYLTTAASPSGGGTVLPVSGWYNSQAVVPVSAAANSGYSFTGFSGALSGTGTPQNVTMNGAESVTAGFSVGISSVTLNSASSNITLPSGQTANLVVWLSGPAPAGGVTITLTSSNPSVVSLSQGSVTILQGATSSPGVTVTAGSIPAAATISANGGLFGAATGPQITVTTGSTMYSVSGSVTLAGGTTALPGVTVSLGGSGTATVQTAADGSYSFSVPAGSYTVGVAMQGYGFNPGTWTNSSLSSNQPGVNFSGGVRTIGTPSVLPGTPSSCSSGNAILNNSAAQSLAYCLGYSIGGVFYCNDSDNGAHTSAFSVSGSGVTASLAGSPSQCAPGHPSTFDVSFTATPSSAPTSRNMSLVYTDRASNLSITLANALQVYDATPVINAVSGDPTIYAGSQSYASIYGSNFGGSGSVQVCTNSTGTCVVAAGFSASTSAQYSYWSDTQVNVLLTSPSSSVGGTFYLQVVVSTDVSGATFLASAQESSGSASNESPFTPVPEVQVTPGPTAIMGSAAEGPAASIPPANCAQVQAAGQPSGGAFLWSTASQSVNLGNANAATVTVCSNPGYQSSQPGDVAVNVTYTVGGETSLPATTAITILWPSAIQTASDTTNSTGHQCIGTQGAIPDNSFTQASSYYADTLAGATYLSYLRNRTYQFQDQFQNPITLFMSLNESYPPGTANVNTGSGVGAVATDFLTRCSQTCRQGGSETASSTQTIYANNVPLPTKQVTWTCSAVTIVP